MNISRAHNIVSIKRREDIKLILDKGKKVFTKFGVIFFYNINNDNAQKYAAVLLKKSVGGAVKRNYIKRMIRSVIRLNHMLLFKKYNSVIFIYNKKGDNAFSRINIEYVKAVKKFYLDEEKKSI